jgi:hypothetical protein
LLLFFALLLARAAARKESRPVSDCIYPHPHARAAGPPTGRSFFFAPLLFDAAKGLKGIEPREPVFPGAPKITEWILQRNKLDGILAAVGQATMKGLHWLKECRTKRHLGSLAGILG